MAGERLKMGVVGAGAFASRRHLPRLREWEGRRIDL